MAITKEEIQKAAILVQGHVRNTPVMNVGSGCFGLGHDLNLKLECLQHSGSFKVRGVFNHLLQDIPRAKRTGVVAASGGNHGAAVAYAAHKLGISANIFVPEIASPAKIQRIKRYGATVHVGGARYADALNASTALCQQSGAMSIHAYDQEATVIGQGTVAEEWQTQSPTLDTVLIAVGGGGLIGGMAAWYRDDLRIIACEPKTSCAFHAALAAGSPVDVSVDGIAADSLGAKQVGAHMFPIAKQFISHSVIVDDEAIALAQSALWAEMQVVAEPGGATALAAIISGAYQPSKGERVGVLICGGNTDSLPVSNTDSLANIGQ